MRYLSVCSGIEAATVAWHPLGWTPAAFSEIDKAARRALAEHARDLGIPAAEIEAAVDAAMATARATP